MIRRIALAATFVLSAFSANAALVIAKAPTSNVTCAAGICTATAADAVLNIKDVKTLLKAGDLTIASGSAAEDIAFNATLNWTKPHRLTLDAYRSIAFTQPVTAEGTGAVTLTTNDGGTGGDYSFTDKGKIAFWDLSSSLIINGAKYTLVGDVATLSVQITKNPNRNYALARYYDASADGVYGASPIITAFNGKFDGLGHAIDNLSIAFNKKDLGIDAGLFLEIGSKGVVRNLQLTSPNIQVFSKHKQDQFVGALAGRNAGKIRDVQVIGGNVWASETVGGLVGWTSGTVANSHVVETSVQVTGGFNGGGGLAGDNSGTIASSGSSAAVVGNLGTFVGGLLGNNFGSVSLSYSSGTVEAGGAQFGNDGSSYSGGFVDYNEGTIDQSWSSSPVYGGTGAAGGVHESDNYTGGFADQNFGTISRSYVTGAVSAGEYIYMGGFVRFNAQGGEIDASYTISSLTCSYCEAKGPFFATGCPAGSDDYWDSDTTFATGRSKKSDDCPAVSSLTDAQLKSGLPAGFTPSIWGQSASINDGYPYLLANSPQ